MKFKLLLALMLVAVVAGLYGWWRMDLRWRPHDITRNQAEIEKLLEQSGWVSPGLAGPKLYVIGHHACPDCARFKREQFPALHAAGIDTRLIEVARADQEGVAQSTRVERATVAELWVNRSWALSQRWDETPIDNWTAQGIPPTDNDVARTAVVEAGRAMVDKLAPLLKANGIGLGYPLLVWRAPDGGLRGCVCDNPETQGYALKELS
jgi:hypothetical protein